jgi:hypothetical protein
MSEMGSFWEVGDPNREVCFAPNERTSSARPGMSEKCQLQASNRFTAPPFVNQAFVFSFFVSWVALFVDAGLTQFVPL